MRIYSTPKTMARWLSCLCFFALILEARSAESPPPTDSSITQFVSNYFSSWSHADFSVYRSCFHPSATVTFKDNTGWKRWDLQQFLNDQESLQTQHRLEEVPLAIHIKSMLAETAFVEVPWKLELLPTANTVTGIDWYTLVKHEQTWQILNLTFWEDAPDPPDNQTSVTQPKTKIIVSGFEGFAGRSMNASSELAKAIRESFPELDITFVQVPVVWGAPEETIAKNRALKPAVWIAFGEGAADFQIETIATNHRANIRDNRNQLPSKDEIIAGGAKQLKLEISPGTIATRLQELGYAPKISTNAGQYLCEEMLYSLLNEEHTSDSTLKQVLFIHVPIYGSTVRIRGKQVPFSGSNIRIAAHDLFSAVAQTLQLKSLN